MAEPTVSELTAELYEDLKTVARQRMRRQRISHTLQTTALVHEAFSRIADRHEAKFTNRLHFFAYFSEVMRRLLIEHARKKGAVKRGRGRIRAAFDEAIANYCTERGVDPAALLDLSSAIDDLKCVSPRAANVVLLRFFGNRTEPEIAAVLNVSRRTVSQQIEFGKAFLFQKLKERNDAQRS